MGLVLVSEGAIPPSIWDLKVRSRATGEVLVILGQGKPLSGVSELLLF